MNNDLISLKSPPHGSIARHDGPQDNMAGHKEVPDEGVPNSIVNGECNVEIYDIYSSWILFFPEIIKIVGYSIYSTQLGMEFRAVNPQSVTSMFRTAYSPVVRSESCQGPLFFLQVIGKLHYLELLY